VMAEQKQNEKVEEEKKPGFKKTAEYRRFRKLLKQVIKAPPLRRDSSPSTLDIMGRTKTKNRP
jgi:hypothetical protein